jgi:hypothetical protein
LQHTEIGLGSSAGDSGKLLLKYGYRSADNNGNVQSQTITVGSFSLRQSTSMMSCTGPGARRKRATTSQAWQQVYKYDRFGNRMLDAEMSAARTSR